MQTGLRPWQLVAASGAAIVTLVMGAAAVSYSAGLGDGTPLMTILGYTATTSQVFGAMALAVDLLMIAMLFGIVHWSTQGNRLAAVMCGVIFVAASLMSIYAVRGFISLNVTRSLAPAAQQSDIYGSIRSDLVSKQSELDRLRWMSIPANRQDRAAREAMVAQAERKVDELRAKLQSAPVGHTVSPMTGYETIAAAILWLFHSMGWFAAFGGQPRNTGADSKNNAISTGSDNDGDDGDNGEPPSDTVVDLARIRRARSSPSGVADDGHVSAFLSTLSEDRYDWQTISGLYAAYCMRSAAKPMLPRHLARRLIGEQWQRTDDGAYERRTLAALAA